MAKKNKVTHTTKNYVIEKYKSRDEWLKHRVIGGTDLVKLINFKSRWGNFIELYDTLTNKDNIVQKTDTIAMSNGRRAEEPIKELFLVAHSELTRISPKTSLWLIRRKDYPEITLSPDTIVKDGQGNLGYIEIKLKQIYNENQIPQYLQCLKEEEPQYYWQNIHYYVSMNDLKFGYLVVAFEVMKKNEETQKWEFDKYIIDSLYFTREIVSEDIKQGEEALIDFITNNLRPHNRPQVVLKEEQGKEEEIEWNNLSNIQILKH